MERPAGDFDFEGEVVAEAQRYLTHRQKVELAGARLLMGIAGRVRAQAVDAIVTLVKAERR